MLIPNIENAYIPEEKLTGYLLSETHSVGAAKSRFFRGHGYSHDSIERLARDLLEIVRNNPIEREVVTVHGTKYLVGVPFARLVVQALPSTLSGLLSRETIDHAL